ncbi:LuxR C-terminal-related transcriptional regulator [Siphonobacter sp. SORGH_AS_1065]|nr:helix-turn-helix transcriptional regulator [Siphonobacter sp. SORGH_AS_1065]MDQ1087915.1 DNA-binding CsgD family transcriptional regulator [Siphonobacter sp. SORGH_AS_1065]
MDLITPLTRREIEILYYVAQGMTTEQIAEQLYLSVHTVARTTTVNNLAT